MARQAILPRLPWGGLFLNETGARQAVLPGGFINEAGGGASLTVAPGVGALTITGFAPNGVFGTAPAAGSLIITGFAPNSGSGATPSAGALTISGFAPVPITRPGGSPMISIIV